MSEVPPHSEIGGYRIERLIGRGGMSAVYLAEHARLKRKVALKVLSPELARDERFRERFIRESELAASLEDPNVLPIYEAGEQDGVLFIAMRYLDGTDLKTLLEQESPLEPDRVAVIIGQIASALDAAHAKGLVHRDVKPGNILVTRTASSPPADLAFLVDFGLTKRATSDSGLTGTGVFAGTLSYAAPEQFEGGPLDGRTDVYSLGCVVFECLTGVAPFRKEQDAALMHAHLHEPPPSATALRPDLPPAIDGVVARAMAKRPDQRYPRAGDLAAALRASLGDGGSPEAPAPRRSGRRWLPIAAVVAVLVLATGIAVATLGEDPPSGPTSTGPNPSAPAPGQPPPPGSVNRFDPATGAVTLTVPDVSGLEATAVVDPSLAVGEGGLWAHTWPPRGLNPSLIAMDETTGAVRGVIAIPAGIIGGTALAVADRTVWFTGGVVEAVDAVSRINPATLEPLPPVRVDDGSVTDIVLGGEVLFVGSTAGILTAFDALTGDELMQADLDAQPDELAFGAGWLWALDPLANQVMQIDPADGTVVQRIDVSGNLKDIAAGDGGVWVLDDLAGTVVQIDPETGAVGDAIRVGPAPSAIAVGLGSAWITDAEDGNIYRVDPQRGSPEPIDLGAPLIAVAVDEATGSLWVAVLDTEG
ncbi:MAG TPA: protein kinase [Actinomycetota bacterium]|jgi:serine/threonine-protein kinase